MFWNEAKALKASEREASFMPNYRITINIDQVTAYFFDFAPIYFVQ